MSNLHATFLTDDEGTFSSLQRAFEGISALEAVLRSPLFDGLPRVDAIFLSASAAERLCKVPGAYAASVCSTTMDPVVSKYAPLAVVGGVLAPGDDPFNPMASYRTFSATLRAILDYNAKGPGIIETILLPAFWFTQPEHDTVRQCEAVAQAYKDHVATNKIAAVENQ